jgi:Zn-dependent peptidase ImmA (M78 family)
MRKRELKSFMVEWQKIIGLYRWSMGLSYVSKEEMDDPEEYGMITIDDEKNTALIQINKDIKVNQKRTILHELGHLTIVEMVPENQTNEQIKAEEVVVRRLEDSWARLAGLPDEEEACGATKSGHRRRARKRSR